MRSNFQRPKRKGSHVEVQSSFENFVASKRRPIEQFEMVNPYSSASQQASPTQNISTGSQVSDLGSQSSTPIRSADDSLGGVPSLQLTGGETQVRETNPQHMATQRVTDTGIDKNLVSPSQQPVQPDPNADDVNMTEGGESRSANPNTSGTSSSSHSSTEFFAGET